MDCSKGWGNANMRVIAEAIGWIVIIMFVLGVLDVADFRLIFKAKQDHVSIHDNTVINIDCQKGDVKMQEQPRDLLTLQFKFPNTMAANEVESLACAMIGQAEGAEVTADTTGVSQCIAERLQVAYPEIKLAQLPQ
jgi:hypothetical protein